MPMNKIVGIKKKRNRYLVVWVDVRSGEGVWVVVEGEVGGVAAEVGGSLLISFVVGEAGKSPPGRVVVVMSCSLRGPSLTYIREGKGRCVQEAKMGNL